MDPNDIVNAALEKIFSGDLKGFHTYGHSYGYSRGVDDDSNGTMYGEKLNVLGIEFNYTTQLRLGQER